MLKAHPEPARPAVPPASQTHSANQAALIGQWQHVRGRTREWWGRLIEGDLDRARQFERFVGRLQQRHGYNRERAAMILRRRMLKHRASQPKQL